MTINARKSHLLLVALGSAVHFAHADNCVVSSAGDHCGVIGYDVIIDATGTDGPMNVTALGTVSCSAGFVATGSPAAACNATESATFSFSGCGCSAGFSRQNSSQQCTVCNLGTHALKGATSCTACPAGKFDADSSHFQDLTTCQHVASLGVPGNTEFAAGIQISASTSSGASGKDMLNRDGNFYSGLATLRGTSSCDADVHAWTVINMTAGVCPRAGTLSVTIAGSGEHPSNNFRWPVGNDTAGGGIVNVALLEGATVHPGPGMMMAKPTALIDTDTHADWCAGQECSCSSCGNGPYESAWAPESNCNDPRYVTIDLGRPFELSSVTVWNWNTELAGIKEWQFCGTRVAVSMNNTFKGEELVVHDSKGAIGSIETSSGTTHKFAPTVARFVRYWSAGAAASNYDVKMIEVAAYGRSVEDTGGIDTSFKSKCAHITAKWVSGTAVYIANGLSSNFDSNSKAWEVQFDRLRLNTVGTSAETPCADCLAGRITNFTGATSCSLHCAPGMYAAAGSAKCDQCAIGMIDHDADPGTPCTDCPAGKTSKRALTCEACQADTYSTRGGSCISCFPGRFSQPGSTEASLCECPTGTFPERNETNASCVHCPAGTAHHAAGGGFTAALKGKNDVPSYIYYFKVAQLPSGEWGKDYQGAYCVDLMVQQCAKIGMKPICDHRAWCGKDPKVLFIGQTHQLGYKPHRVNNVYMPEGFSTIQHKFDHLCGYSGNANGNYAICNIPINTHAWRHPGQYKPGFMCARVLAPAGSDFGLLRRLQSVPAISSTKQRRLQSYVGRSSDVQATCVQCDLGYYDHDNDASIGCELCPSGRYQDTYQASECKACPRSMVSIVGSGSPDSCNTAPKYVGCFQDRATVGFSRDLTERQLNMGPNASVALCARLCAGLKYMGMQSDDQCRCGNSYGRYGDSARCGTVGSACGVHNTAADLSGCAMANAIYRIAAWSCDDVKCAASQKYAADA